MAPPVCPLPVSMGSGRQGALARPRSHETRGDGGPPKKRKTTKSSETSIVPFQGDELPASSMSFPPSQSLESAAVRKGKSANSASIGSKRSRSGSNQLEPIPVSSEQTSQETIAPVKAKAKRKRKQPAKKTRKESGATI